MATTQKKPASGTRSAPAKKKPAARSGGASRSTASRGGTRSRSTAKKNTKKPIRREVTGLVYLVLALCILVSYFSSDGSFIAFLPIFLKGILGFGYYLTAPALAVGAYILLTHRGRPVVLRTTCALVLPYLFGGLCHMLFCRQNFSSPSGVLPKLWNTGRELLSGGVLSGGTAVGFMSVLGKPASAIIFAVLIFALVMVAFQISLSTLIQLWKDRERLDYREEDYEDEEEDDGFFEPVAVKPAPNPAPRKQRQPAPPGLRSTSPWTTTSPGSTRAASSPASSSPRPRAS